MWERIDTIEHMSACGNASVSVRECVSACGSECVNVTACMSVCECECECVCVYTVQYITVCMFEC